MNYILSVIGILYWYIILIGIQINFCIVLGNIMEKAHIYYENYLLFTYQIKSHMGVIFNDLKNKVKSNLCWWLVLGWIIACLGSELLPPQCLDLSAVMETRKCHSKEGSMRTRKFISSLTIAKTCRKIKQTYWPPIPTWNGFNLFPQPLSKTRGV